MISISAVIGNYFWHEKHWQNGSPEAALEVLHPFCNYPKLCLIKSLLCLISVHGVTFIPLCGNMSQKQICDRRREKRADDCSIVAVRNSVAQLKLRKSQREMSEFYVRSESTFWTLIDGFRGRNKHPDNNDSLISVALFRTGVSFVLNFYMISSFRDNVNV